MSDGTQAVELLPCPFCGGEADAIELDMPLDLGYYVACRKCDGQMGDSQDLYRNRDVVAEMWNRRATPSPVGASVLWSDERITNEAYEFAKKEGAHSTDAVEMIARRIRDDYEAARGASVPVPQDIAETLREALIYHRSESIIWASIEDNEDSVKRIDTALTWLERQGQG